MYRMLLVSLFVLVFTYACQSKKTDTPVLYDFAKYVDPLIGTGGTGHTFPGAVLPYGMVQLSPDTDIGGWERCAGYHATDSTILGFSLTHLSGTGNADLGDVMLMPFVGKAFLHRGTSMYPDTTYRSRFRKETEVADPGYYRVLLDDYHVLAEMTVSERVGMHRYTFPETDSAGFIMDLSHRVIRDIDRGGRKWAYTQYDDSVSVSGYIVSTGWAKDRKIFWAMEFSKPLNRDRKEKIVTGIDHRIVVHFETEQHEQVLVKVAYSPVSIVNARLNLQEIPHWDFDIVRKQARETWNKELNKIAVQDSDSVKKTIFYTAMYHAMIHPSLFMDVNGQYRGTDNTVYQAKKMNNHTVFSLWDTYRALHPLLTIIQPERNSEFVYNMLRHYEQSPYRMLPIWELHSNETWTMIGYHAIPVITDAYFKGLIDKEDAGDFLEAMVTTATKHPYGAIEDYVKYGYVPVWSSVREPVSMTLEYAYNDWCIAKMAEDLGEKAIAEEFYLRSESYRNLWDPVSGFMRARDTLGELATRSPTGTFSPFRVQWKGDYTEGNAWQYTWYVPHNIPDLIDLMGGKQAFGKKLDSFFVSKSDPNVASLRDVSGLIGQYAHGNEPSHHIPYLYNYIGQTYKTQEIVDTVLNYFYLAERDGIIGNEDCGQMSAWYIFSSLGFYPVNPASGVYVIGKPNVEKAEIRLRNKKVFCVMAHNLSKENIYIDKVKLNGEIYDKSWIDHNDIIQGGEISFFMTDKPSEWGMNAAFYPMDSVYF